MQLIFVYNAESNPLKQAFNFFKRLSSPETFDCNLIKLTHYGINMKKEWQDFLQSLPIAAKFYHHDMFHKKYPDYKTNFPVVLSDRGDGFEVFLSTPEIIAISSLNELISLVNKKLAK